MQFPFKLAENKEFDVVGFGTNAVDYLIVVPEYPQFDSKIELTNYIRACGGEVATTTVGLSRLGLKTSYVGRFGDDAEGNFGLQSLVDEGVDTRFAAQIEGARTQIAFIVIDERSGERTVIWDRDKRLAYAETDAPLEVAALGKILHFTPHDTRACLKLAREAKAAGGRVSIDIDNVFEGVEELLPLVDIMICSAEFPEKLFDVTDPKTALREIKSRFGCAVAGLTLGEKGSLILCENEYIESRGFAVPNGAKDTTGAGDSFRAGFLFGLLTGETVENSAQFANAVAALKCRELGARTALPDREELLRFIRNSSQ
jgi:sugar/nucleoside kinase (ribokinase family)